MYSALRGPTNWIHALYKNIPFFVFYPDRFVSRSNVGRVNAVPI